MCILSVQKLHCRYKYFFDRVFQFFTSECVNRSEVWFLECCYPHHVYILAALLCNLSWRIGSCHVAVNQYFKQHDRIVSACSSSFCISCKYFFNFEFIYCFTDNSYKMILRNQLIKTWWQEPLSPWLYGLYVILSLTPLLIFKF